MASDPLPKQQKHILDALQNKAHIKSCVYDQSLEVFNELKDVLSEISNDLNDILSESEANRRIRLEYRDRGKFEAELKFADDVLGIMQFGRMHTQRSLLTTPIAGL